MFGNIVTPPGRFIPTISEEVPPDALRTGLKKSIREDDFI
jgi:hypothetical protein